MNLPFLLAFGTYSAVLVAITLFFYKKNAATEGSTEFSLGNRSLNYVATAIAAHSSDMSIWLFMGFPGTVYLLGIPTLWVPIGLTIGMYASWKYVAPQLRALTESYNVTTLSEYFEKRLDDTSGRVRTVSALFGLLFFFFYISSGLVGMGIMFESVFGINYYLGITIGLAITILYTYLGGFNGIAFCDFFQGLFLVSMIVIVPLFGYFLLPFGYSSIIGNAALKSISLSLWPLSIKELLLSLLLAIGWGLGYFGQPHILVNFMGIKNINELGKARTVGMIWQFATLLAALSIGLIGIGLFSNLKNPELVFVSLVQLLFNPFVAGLVLCAILAAGITTIDTQILVSASLFSQDVYKPLFAPQATEKEILQVAKKGVLILPLISFLIACTKSSSVYGLVNYAWMGLGSTFGPLMIVSLYSTKVNARGALIGMIAGALCAALWPLFNSNIPSMIPAFGIHLLILILTKNN